MSKAASRQMMALLQELAALKELERQSEDNPTGSSEEERSQRKQRHDEITQEIRAFGEPRNQRKAPRRDKD